MAEEKEKVVKLEEKVVKDTPKELTRLLLMGSPNPLSEDSPEEEESKEFHLSFMTIPD
eukprot:CAMPEP_0205849168 /NCGR_PEP_ID=MMETSP1019-20131125/4024_1 /ASSEMBLY_ACC=CAM_ASM_000403 /TAXON_ID=46462 /ORGANISM="Anophryoides haemophila, Strain AH6" /LENGTH=57 /DNA_ID=CAMNT_0053169537 /DNA_START=55 /DNA_END=226 /DNA_ORIENTATION=-